MRSWRVTAAYTGLAVALGSFPAMTGCNTTEGALLGAGLGAGTGALAGGLSRHAGAGTAIGAGAGALIGGIMGSQFEQMEKQRQSQGYPPPSYPAGGTGPTAVNQPYSQPGYYGQPYQQHPYAPGAPVPQAVVRGEPPQSYETARTATPISTVVTCPNCKQSLDVSEFKRGSKVRCPACNEVFVY